MLASAYVERVSEWGSRWTFGVIIATPIRSAAITHPTATLGSPATSHPIRPPPATAIRDRSVALMPPSP